eukprot:TRINITY_DN3235_c0_g1_i3.p1 TRINITY_DN3235_c0_g1~~TRINITY_DN3235_c0_g1_i3.p1  ORF type:complete len:245 (-),score=81.58 TRINITY_DN3235_c0_g1_i3:231-965(-)
MTVEQAQVLGVLIPLQLYPVGYRAQCGIHQAVECAMAGQWTEAFMSTFKETVHEHVNGTQSVIDACTKYHVTYDEACAIVYYSSDAGQLGGESSDSVYRVLNPILATRATAKIHLWRDFTVALISGLNKLPKHTGEVFRALDKRLTKLSPQYKVGNKAVWVAFTSCTSKRDLLQQFSGSRNDEGTWMSISVKNGCCIGEFSLFPEDEVLLQPNTVVRVEQIVHDQIKVMLNFPTSMDFLRLSEL